MNQKPAPELHAILYEFCRGRPPSKLRVLWWRIREFLNF